MNEWTDKSIDGLKIGGKIDPWVDDVMTRYTNNIIAYFDSASRAQYKSTPIDPDSKSPCPPCLLGVPSSIHVRTNKQ